MGSSIVPENKSHNTSERLSSSPEINAAYRTFYDKHQFKTRSNEKLPVMYYNTLNIRMHKWEDIVSVCVNIH